MAPCMTDSSREADRCGLNPRYVADFPFHANLTRNCASVLTEAMKAPACPANQTELDLDTFRSVHEVAELARHGDCRRLVASSAARRWRRRSRSPRWMQPAGQWASALLPSIRTLPPASSGKEMRRFTSKHPRLFKLLTLLLYRCAAIAGSRARSFSDRLSLPNLKSRCEVGSHQLSFSNHHSPRGEGDCAAAWHVRLIPRPCSHEQSAGCYSASCALVKRLL
jgi:hypothetical protein